MALYNIADILVQMEVSGRTLQQAAPYEVQQGTPQVRLRVDAKNMLELNPRRRICAGAIIPGRLPAPRVLCDPERKGLSVLRAQRNRKIHPYGKVGASVRRAVSE